MAFRIRCANCGCCGHVYRDCNHPLISFGIICFRQNPAMDNRIEYLLVQRKDSLSFTEFMRGKYKVNDIAYILKLYSNMTQYERELLQTLKFDDLWRYLWQSNDQRAYTKEISDARAKFEMIRSGYDVNTESFSEKFSLEYLANNTECMLDEPEWGFPKGRRNINENDVACAKREFREETGMNMQHLTMLTHVNPVEEVFSGSNNVRYKHIYYLAKCECPPYDTAWFNPDNKVQTSEIKDVRWMDAEDVLTHISMQNMERRELFKRVDGFIPKLI